MGFRCGIVGLPNVGKSTLFNALTRSGIPAENYPFCTIEPNLGIVAVPDERLERLAAIARPEKVVPTAMEFVDIAGLVAGASQGEGLGNQFLGHIREVDAIAHVVRCFDDPDVAHVSGEVDPLRDIEIVDTELMLADLDTAERALERARKTAKAGDKALVARAALVERVYRHLAGGRPARTLALGMEEARSTRDLHLLTAKPTMYVANVSERELGGNRYVERVEEIAAEQRAEVVVVCAAIEAELADLPDADRAEFLADLGLAEPGLDRVVQAGYRLLGLRTFFTAGPKEVRAWTVSAGSTAPQGAGRIHTDFERGFIRAEVIAYDDYLAHRGEQGAKDAGRWRLEGRDYRLREGDVVHFRFNV